MPRAGSEQPTGITYLLTIQQTTIITDAFGRWVFVRVNVTILSHRFTYARQQTSRIDAERDDFGQPSRLKGIAPGVVLDMVESPSVGPDKAADGGLSADYLVLL